MAAFRDIAPAKRKRPILNDDSSDESEVLPVNGATSTSSTDVQSFIRPPTTNWARGTGSSPQHSFARERSFSGFGISQEAAKKPRLEAPEHIRSNRHSSGEPISPGSSENSGEDAIPPVHHMFDVSGRVPPPPRPTRSEDEDEDDELDEDEPEDDTRMSGIVPTGITRSRLSSTSLPDQLEVDRTPSRQNSLPSPPASGVRAPHPTPTNASFNRLDRAKMSIHNLVSSQNVGTTYVHERSEATPEVVMSEDKFAEVTLLIEDRRSEDVEPEVVAITIKISPGPPGAPYWNVDCEELVDKLQLGPSRVDGLAKVFCLRTNDQGRVLRQCILRLEPHPIVGKGLVRVPLSLELRIVLEKLPIRQGDPEEGNINPLVRADGRVPIPPTPTPKRAPRVSLVSGLEDIKSGKVRYQHPEAHWPQPKDGGEVSAEVVATLKHPQTPAEQASDRAAKSKKAMADYVRPLIQADPFWPTFHESKGHVKSNNDAVKCLQFFESLVETYINRHFTIPARIPYAGGKRLTKAALLEAVGRGTTWSSDCHIVLELIKRFGPGGPDEKQEVVELLNSNSTKGGLTEFVAKMKRIKADHDKSREQ